MKTIEIVTLKAAHEHLLKEGKGRNGYVKLSDLRALCLPAIKPKSGWSYKGDGLVIRRCFA